jgi:hypothetical protein
MDLYLDSISHHGIDRENFTFVLPYKTTRIGTGTNRITFKQISQQSNLHIIPSQTSPHYAQLQRSSC